MTRPPLNLLFTSAGRRVELLRAFRRALDALGLEGAIVATDIDRLAPALHVADRGYLVPRCEHPDYIPELTEICRREAIARIFPLIDPEIPVLAQHRAELQATGARLAVVSAEAARITADKWSTTRWLEGLGLPVPKSWLPEELASARPSFPLFVKPRAGSASRDAYKVASAAELAFFLGYVREPIVEEFLAGPEVTSDVVCDVDGELLAVVSRQRIEVRWGEVAKGVTLRDLRIEAACARIAAALPACGPITVQCIFKDDEPRFTEINARFGGGAPLGFAAGADTPRWLVARAAGLGCELPPLGSYRTGLYMTRFDDALCVTGDELERFEGRRLRPR